MVKHFPVVVLLLVCFFLTPLPAEKSIFVYQEKTKDQVTTHQFEIQSTIDGFEIRLSSKESNSTILQTFTLNPKLETLAWTFQETEKNTAISARREGIFILLTGIHKGKPIEKKLKTKKLPWNQLFNKGLEPFARSNVRKTKFRAIGTRGSGDMKITSFIVKRKEKPEIIKIKGRDVATVHLKISLSGLLSIFWTGHYWFRLNDGVFVRYKGKNGPGKPLTIMELTGETEETE